MNQRCVIWYWTHQPVVILGSRPKRFELSLNTYVNLYIPLKILLNFRQNIGLNTGWSNQLLQNQHNAICKHPFRCWNFYDWKITIFLCLLIVAENFENLRIRKIKGNQVQWPKIELFSDRKFWNFLTLTALKFFPYRTSHWSNGQFNMAWTKTNYCSGQIVLYLFGS